MTGPVYVIAGMLVFFGFIWLMTREDKEKEHTLMTEEDLLLYREAAKILNRLININDLNDPFDANIISQETRTAVEAWLAKYKKELHK